MSFVSPLLPSSKVARGRVALVLCGPRRRRLQVLSQVLRRLAASLLATALCLGLLGPALAAPVKIVAYGDSLSAGYMLPADAAFPTVLERALKAHGHDVQVVNAGVSGDTATMGLARFDWTLADGADAVILELGANDMLRGTDPKITRDALDSMLGKLRDRKIKVLLAGMLASPSLGPQYEKSFDSIYPDLAHKYNVPLYPFFLDGIATEASLKLSDGMHPNRTGVERIVERILPSVEALLDAVRPKS